LQNSQVGLGVNLEEEEEDLEKFAASVTPGEVRAVFLVNSSLMKASLIVLKSN